MHDNINEYEWLVHHLGENHLIGMVQEETLDYGPSHVAD
jgi:hypothetical protein